MINITYDHQAFCNSQYGGIARYAYEVASRSASLDDFKVRVLAGFYTNQYLANSNSMLVRGMRVPTVPKSVGVLRRVNATLAASYLSLRTPDIFHETYYSQRNIAPKSKSCQTVLTVYDMIHEKFQHMMPANIRKTLEAKEASIRRADHIICISERTKQDLIDIFSIPSDKVSTIHLGFSLSSSNEANLSLPSFVDRPYLLYVGARSGYKNFNRFIQAYASGKEIKQNFSVVCFGGQNFSSEELELFRSLELAQEQVIYISGNDQILASLYQNAAAFVYPSLYEGFGIPPLEAMSFQCPVICSNAGSIPEVVDDAASYFDPNHLDSIIESIQAVVFSATRAQDLIHRGTERLSAFSWEKCAQETQAVYRQLVGVI